MADCEMHEECEKRFDKIDNRLDDGDHHFTEHDKAIVRLETQFAQLTQSMSNLTKAIWGACGTALITLAGFFIWYVQNKH